MDTDIEAGLTLRAMDWVLEINEIYLFCGQLPLLRAFCQLALQSWEQVEVGQHHRMHQDAMVTWMFVEYRLLKFVEITLHFAVGGASIRHQTVICSYPHSRCLF